MGTQGQIIARAATKCEITEDGELASGFNEYTNGRHVVRSAQQLNTSHRIV